LPTTFPSSKKFLREKSKSSLAVIGRADLTK
jgi:hypothetical protein